MKNEEKINSEYGYDTANEKQAICENRNSDKVIRYEAFYKFSDRFIELKMNGSVWGVYYNENNEVVVETVDSETFIETI